MSEKIGDLIMLERFIINLTSNKTRRETLEGREYIVAPMVMATECVMNGSNGPLYYPKEELSKTPSCWNHKPIVIYHPEMNGVGVSACNPAVLETRKVGLIMNSNWDNKLRAEAWLEESKLKKVDPRVLDALEKGKLMEVSTGLFTDNEVKSGSFNGKSYIGIARNYRPDHLAILPDKIGACSIEDGAGLLQTNELSFSGVSRQLDAALSAAYGKPGQEWCGWLVDVFPSYVIFYDDGQLFMTSYEQGKDVINLKGDAVPVTRTTVYRTSDGTVVGNMGGMTLNLNQQKDNEMKTKEERVAALIGNKSGPWKEEDKTFLMSQTEERLDGFLKLNAAPVNPTPTPTPNNTPAVVPVTQPTTTTQPVATPAVNQQTLEQYVANAPVELRDVLTEGVAAHKAEKTRLIATITANQNNAFTKEYLEAAPLTVLRGIAALAATPVVANQNQPQVLQTPSYFGAATPAPTTNNTQRDDKPLALPVLDFSKK